MTRKRVGGLYGARGAVLRRARRVEGLAEEIALLRALLAELVEPADWTRHDERILSAVAVLVRALLAEAKLSQDSPEEVLQRLGHVVRELGGVLDGDPGGEGAGE